MAYGIKNRLLNALAGFHGHRAALTAGPTVELIGEQLEQLVLDRFQLPGAQKRKPAAFFDQRIKIAYCVH